MSGASEKPLLKLWVDDQRDPPTDHVIEGNHGWAHALNSADAIVCLKVWERLDVMSLDFSLGNKPDGDWDDVIPILTWLRDNSDKWPREVRAHSGSSSGRWSIEQFVKDHAPKDVVFVDTGGF